MFVRCLLSETRLASLARYGAVADTCHRRNLSPIGKIHFARSFSNGLGRRAAPAVLAQL